MHDSEDPEGEQTPCGCHDEEAAPRRESRWSLAFRVLLGEPVVPRQIRLEWLEYRLMFDDILTRFSTQLARKAKAERRQIRDELAEPTRRPVPTPSGGKARVRALMAEARGLRAHVRHTNGAAALELPLPPDLEEGP